MMGRREEEAEEDKEEDKDKEEEGVWQEEAAKSPETDSQEGPGREQPCAVPCPRPPLPPSENLLDPTARGHKPSPG